MANDWTETKLGDIFNVKHGFAFKGEYFTDTPTRNFLLTPGNFSTSGGFQDIKPKYYNGPIPSEYLLKPSQIVVTMTDLSKQSDTLGYAISIPNDGKNWLHNQRTGLLEFKKDKLSNPLFVSYLLRSHEYRSWIIGSATGTTVKHTSPSRIHSFVCKLPPLPEQKAIAHILGSLDDKIELNRQMNQTLEAMAQALFKSWFVDFDPVIDNALAAGKPIPDELSERAEQRKAVQHDDNQAVRALFPDEFVLTEEMGWIPKGWAINNISSLCEKIQSGGTPRRNVSEFWENGTIPWLTSGEVRQTIIIKVENKISESGLSNSSAKWLESGATVVAMYGATAGQVAYVDKSITTNQAVCGLIPKKGYQFFNYVTLSRAVSHFEGQATGSAQQNINKGLIENTRVITPSSINSDSFEEHCKMIFSKWINNLHENETLSKLRDTLLPKLLSGELRIPDAAALVEDI